MGGKRRLNPTGIYLYKSSISVDFSNSDIILCFNFTQPTNPYEPQLPLQIRLAHNGGQLTHKLVNNAVRPSVIQPSFKLNSPLITHRSSVTENKRHCNIATRERSSVSYYRAFMGASAFFRDLWRRQRRRFVVVAREANASLYWTGFMKGPLVMKCSIMRQCLKK